MDETRVERLTELLDRALDLPASRRREFIHTECDSDVELRTELASLIEASDSASGYFDRLEEEIVAPAYESLRNSGSRNLLALLSEALGSGHTIERELGGAGMSRVFLAEEVSLRRKVVIKVLPPELASTVSRDRFRREIQLVAQLQHAHIVPLLSSGSTGTLVWFTMPFVAGESLRARLRRDGAVPVREAIKLWRDILDALSHAHSTGVMHRDIKPGNILLSGRNALVTDFGVARAIEMSADADSSGGLGIGTPAYMAPEQVTEEPVIDHRADLYASALVMHEMLEGKQTFSGGTTGELLRARIGNGPPALTRNDCPEGLQTLVMRCLAQRPDDRPSTAEEVLNELDDIQLKGSSVSTPNRLRRMMYAVGTVAALSGAAFIYQQSRADGESVSAAAPPPSIALMPLRNAGDSSDGSLADGMTEELNGAIGKASGVKVVARSSIDELLSRGLAPMQVAESLGVSHLLEGDLEKAGSRIRMRVRLVDVRNGSTRWEERFDREMGDIFAMQDDISRAVALGLNARLNPRVPSRSSTPPTSNIAAYEAYLRAMSPTSARNPESRRRAVRLLEQAVREDSSFAAAYAGLAWHYSVQGEEDEVIKGGKEAVIRKALALDSALPQAHSALGWWLMIQRNMTGARVALNRAISLDPRAHRAYEGLARLYMWTGRPAEQLAAARLGLEAEPLSHSAVREMGLALMMNGRCTEAVKLLEPLKKLTPPAQVAGVIIAQCYMIDKRWSEAIEELRWAEAHGARAALGLRAFALGRSGRTGEAKQILSDLSSGRKESHGAFGIAATYAGLGDNAKALEFFERALDGNLERVYIMSPLFAELHRDPRFARMMTSRMR